MKHYMLYHDGTCHYLRPDKKYESLRDLVADGLIFMFLEARAADYLERLYREASYESSPFVALHAKKREFSLRRTLKNHKTSVVDRVFAPLSPRTHERAHDRITFLSVDRIEHLNWTFSLTRSPTPSRPPRFGVSCGKEPLYSELDCKPALTLRGRRNNCSGNLFHQ